METGTFLDSYIHRDQHIRRTKIIFSHNNEVIENYTCIISELLNTISNYNEKIKLLSTTHKYFKI
jgi:hypothetical protein